MLCALRLFKGMCAFWLISFLIFYSLHNATMVSLVTFSFYFFKVVIIVFHFFGTILVSFCVLIFIACFFFFFLYCSDIFLVHEKLDHDYIKQNKGCTYMHFWLSLHDLNPVLLCKPSCSVADRKYNWHFFLLRLAMLFVLHSRKHSDYPTFWQVLGDFFPFFSYFFMRPQ